MKKTYTKPYIAVESFQLDAAIAAAADGAMIMLTADIDYGTAEAKTAYGRIGVKVWIYKGQVLPTAKKVAKTEGGK